jgi:hypothetical protein
MDQLISPIRSIGMNKRFKIIFRSEIMKSKFPFIQLIPMRNHRLIIGHSAVQQIDSHIPGFGTISAPSTNKIKLPH